MLDEYNVINIKSDIIANIFQFLFTQVNKNKANRELLRDLTNKN
jgi:hypothetical protein